MCVCVCVCVYAYVCHTHICVCIYIGPECMGAIDQDTGGSISGDGDRARGWEGWGTQ